MFKSEIKIQYMIKNNTLQVNSTNNFVKKTKIIQFGYRLAVATMLATTIQSCGSSVGYKLNDPPESAISAVERLAEEVAQRLAAAEAERIRLAAEITRLNEANRMADQALALASLQQTNQNQS